jgi:ABC-type polysaccharide/polyol phosphate transport system ATPase subunit
MAAITFEDVSKRYDLGSRRASIQYLLPDVMGDWLAKRRMERSNGSKPYRVLWALKNVSFEVVEGEMLGLIGPNGAGKTTALSLLAGITSPTQGRITVRGRIGALIKLGAGFHPELTGRENVYLNGAILGLRKVEIDRMYNNIVEFSELGDFMETPVKRYSSGMYVRLGFSVSVHIRPDILLLDEILSVGDVSFQARCFNRIGEIRDTGATVILVSHNLHHISGFCDRVIYLNHGTIKSVGEPNKVLAEYNNDLMGQSGAASDNDGSHMDQVNGTGKISITNVSFYNRAWDEVTQIDSGDALTVRISYRCKEPVENPLLDVVIRDSARGNMFQATNRDFGCEFGRLDRDGYIDIHFNSVVSNNQMLNFFFTLWNSKHTEQYDWKRYIKVFVAGNPVSSGRVLLNCEWRNVVAAENHRVS